MADNTKYSSLVNVPKTKFSTVAFLAIFQVAFIVLFGFFASIKVDKEKEEVPKLYSSIYSFYYLLLVLSLLTHIFSISKRIFKLSF